MSSKGGGNICEYRYCRKSNRYYDNLRLHRFPATTELQEKWIINCGNLDLLVLDEGTLRNRRICSDHFDDSSYINPNNRRRLKRDAVPIPYTTASDAESPPHYCFAVKNESDSD